MKVGTFKLRSTELDTSRVVLSKEILYGVITLVLQQCIHTLAIELNGMKSTKLTKQTS